MASKWPIRQPTSLKRSGVTLIETLVALGLLVGMFMMWQPVVRSLGQFRWRDSEVLAVNAFAQAVQKQVTTGDTLALDDARLVIQKGASNKTVQKYSGKSGELMIFSTTDHGGFEPILTDVDSCQWRLVDSAATYILTMKSGRVYEGVIISDEKTR